jgi:hypothetical protein
LKKIRAYGPRLSEKGYNPVLLILREDNLPAAVKACRDGGWAVYTGDETFQFIYGLTNFDIKAYLTQKAGDYRVLRN